MFLRSLLMFGSCSLSPEAVDRLQSQALKPEILYVLNESMECALDSGSYVVCSHKLVKKLTFF